MHDAHPGSLSFLVVAGCALMMLCGCAPRTARQETAVAAPSIGPPEFRESSASGETAASSIYPDDEVALWAVCSQEEMANLALEAESGDGLKALQMAACYAASLMERSSPKRPGDLDSARSGRRYAELAVGRFPDSGLAHYLVALLTALEAERNPARGLSLVPIVEREALLASRLNPGVDRGGPDRLLGELYLHAPGFPMSLGDSTKSAAHFRRALSYDDDYPENRLGLVEALMAGEENREACQELSRVLADLIEQHPARDSSRAALNLLKRLCLRLEH